MSVLAILIAFIIALMIQYSASGESILTLEQEVEHRKAVIAKKAAQISKLDAKICEVAKKAAYFKRKYEQELAENMDTFYYDRGPLAQEYVELLGLNETDFIKYPASGKSTLNLKDEVELLKYEIAKQAAKIAEQAAEIARWKRKAEHFKRLYVYELTETMDKAVLSEDREPLAKEYAVLGESRGIVRI